LASSIGRLGQLMPVELRPIPGAIPGGPAWQVVAGFRRVAALRLLQRDRVLARIHGNLSDEDAWGLALGPALLTEPLLQGELEALRGTVLQAGQSGWAYDLIDEALVRAPVDPEQRERLMALIQVGDAGAGGALGEAGQEPAPAGEPLPEVEEAMGLAQDSQDTDEVLGEALEDPSLAPSGPESGDADSDEIVEMTPDELADDLTARLYQINQDLAAAYDVWLELPARGRLRILEQMRYVAEMLRLLGVER
jgi:ParB-like chromosome segregation protein Spo0J